MYFNSANILCLFNPLYTKPIPPRPVSRISTRLDVYASSQYSSICLYYCTMIILYYLGKIENVICTRTFYSAFLFVFCFDNEELYFIYEQEKYFTLYITICDVRSLISTIVIKLRSDEDSDAAPEEGDRLNSIYRQLTHLT